jgi:hypothetical protein
MPKQATAAPAGAARAQRSATGRASGNVRATKQGRTSTTRKASKLGRTSTNAQTVPLSKSGVPLTDELIEKLVAEAERGYDLSRARRVGRPSLGRAGGLSPRVNVRISPTLHARANRRAKREGKTLSEVAREALERYVA